MATWAAIARNEGAKNTLETSPIGSDDSRILVVDTNAIISGIRLEGLADKAVTIQEVFDEIKDKQSRDFLATLPFGIEVREPSEDSVAAVSRFARITGDIHTLSAVDIKVLALAHNLEVAAHGSGHIREQPVQVKLRAKQRFKGRALPGWGTVANPEDWKSIDEIEDPIGNAAGGRITHQQDQTQLQGGEIASSTGTGATAAGPPAPEFDSAEGSEDDEGADGDDDGWQTAAKSANSARKQRRRQKRREAWEARQAAEKLAGTSLAAGGQPPTAAASAPPPQHPSGSTEAKPGSEGQGGCAAAGQQLPESVAQNGVAAQESRGRQGEAGDQEPSEDLDEDEDEGQDEDEDEDQDEEEEEGVSGEGEGSSGEEVEGEGTESGVGHDGVASECGSSQPPAVDSRISTITADFAMQNVLLQMGLRLVTKDGRRITRLSRWALRCTACTFVTKEAGRVFCPRCGNMAMERVEVSVGPDGRELFGVRKKHSLRGTRYSLPKPKGGRNSRQPILREDQLLLRKPRDRKRSGPPPGADPFAPEFGMDTVFQNHQTSNAKIMASVPSAKNNPNERKPIRSNRRK